MDSHKSLALCQDDRVPVFFYSCAVIYLKKKKRTQVFLHTTKGVQEDVIMALLLLEKLIYFMLSSFTRHCHFPETKVSA